MIPKVRATFNRNLILLSRQEGAFLDHEYREGGFVEIPFKGDLQPMTPKELDQEPKGEEVKEAIKIYTSSPMLFKNTDVIPYNGKQYRVFSVTPRGGHKKVMAGLLSND